MSFRPLLVSITFLFFSARVYGHTGRSDCEQNTVVGVLTDLAQRQDWSSLAFWAGEARSYAENTREILTSEQALFLSRKALQDPYIDFLESLGFQFEGEIKVPDLVTVLNIIEQKRLDLERAGFKTFRLAEWIQFSNSIKIKILPWGSPLEGVEKSKNVSDTTWVGNEAVVARRFTSGLSRGFFPGGPHFIESVGNRTTAFLHNLGHMMVFLDNPQYADALISKLQEMRELIKSSRREAVKTEQEQLRIFLLTESLIYIPDESKAQLKEVLQITDMDPMSNFEKIHESLAKIPRNEIASFVDRLYLKLPKIIRRLGGGFVEPSLMAVALDPESSDHGRANRILQQGLFDDLYIWLARFKLREAELNKNYSGFLEDEWQNYLKNLTQLMGRLNRLQELSPMDWLNAFLPEAEVKKDSAVYARFCVNPEDQKFLNPVLSKAICNIDPTKF